MRQLGRVIAVLAVALSFLCAGSAQGADSRTAAQERIVFSRGNINLGTAIWAVNGDGSGLVQLTRPPKHALDNEPEWSPNRRQIAFVRELVVGKNFRGDFIRRDHLSVMSADGQEVKRLAVHSHDPAWAPDGRRIAFVKDYAEDEEVWVIRRDGSGARRLALGGHPAWSPDGRELALSRWTGDRYELFVISSTGGDERRLLPSFKGGDFSHARPEWSPDGRQIAFSDDWVYVVNRDGSGLRKLAAGASSKDASAPRWSPDGFRILFERGQGGGPDSTFVISSAGGRAQRIATRTDYPVWSPDGRSVAFAHDLRELRVVSTTGGASRRLARGDSRDLDW